MSERNIWSHRCRTAQYTENNLHGCIQASKVFAGIEIDVHWHDGKFWMHHDHWYQATSTLSDLINLHLSGGLWVDMKTSVPESLPHLIELIGNHTNVMVEVYDKRMIKYLQEANITTTSTSFDTSIRSIWMVRYLFFSVDLPRFMSWHLDFLCLMDTFFESGGELALTDQYYPPDKCEYSLSIVAARGLIWFLSLLLLFTTFSLVYALVYKLMYKPKYSRL